MYYFIVNPNSRSGAGRNIWNMLRSELAVRKITYKAYLTEYVGHATKLAHEISTKGTVEEPAYLITVGGDGTIHEVLTGIQDFDSVIFGYIPTGSGNDFCRGMGLLQDPLKALNCVLRKERIQSMDVPYININNRHHRFGISMGIGYDASVCQEVLASPAKKILNRLGLGKLIYLAVALKQLIFVNPTPMTLYLDGGRRRTYKKVYFTAVMNQKYEGGGFMFCPKAKSNDGILDVIVVEGMSKAKVLCCLPTAFFGRHIHFKGVHIMRCKSIEINSAIPLAIHKDGESGGIRSEISVSVEKKALKVIMPVL
ncbi:diacylglycerol kinase family lipid kinase [Blautia schinkii]|nr:diacylglycerol kinase family lipid kinase [Blautia schinkii]